VITPHIILKNTFYLSVGQITNRILAIVLTLVLTRYLGPENYGSLMLSLAYLGVIGVLIDAGLDVTIIREASRNPNDLGRLIGNGIMIRCVFSFGGYALATSILPFLNYTQETIQLFKFAVLILLVSPLLSFRVILLITQKIKLVAVLDITSQLIKALCIVSIVLLQIGKGEQILIAQFSAAILASIFYIVYGVKVSPQPISFRLDHQLWVSLLKQSLPVMVAGAMYTVKLHGGQLIIGSLLSNIDTGLYSIAFNISITLSFLPSVYFASIYPVMTKYFADDLAKFRWLYRFSFRTMIAISLPICLFISLKSKEIVALFAGEEYLPAAPLLKFLIWGLIFNFSGVVLYHIVLSTSQQYVLTPIAFLGAISYLTLLFICVSVFGLIGSSFALLATYILMFTVYGMIKSTRFYILDWFREAIIPVVAISISLVALVIFHLHPLLIWPTGLIIYIAVLSLFGVATQPEKRFINGLVTRSIRK
jgi:O-antigen/teichoic acid export membrane protein